MSLRKFVALVLLGVVLGGCSLAARTFGRSYGDKVISGSVKHGLVVEHGRSLPTVSIDTYEGTVSLSGDVETSGQKAEAEAAAWRVEGVEQVINDLRVRSDFAVSALPRMEPSPLQARLPGLRVDPALPGSPAPAYDRAGTPVATLHGRTLPRGGAQGLDHIRP